MVIDIIDLLKLLTFYPSESQFRRCISQSFGVVVSDSDFNQIKVKYGSLKKNGMINYRDFVNFLQGGNFFNKISPKFLHEIL